LSLQSPLCNLLVPGPDTNPPAKIPPEA
jgi:hypothetical protein